ncbi:MAG: carbohydrate ABC transporter permease [Defluviitaleaceae bacterium]|nr:carbohydrate ABC transporter permease [Defluviitaleaceae bacterium]
MSASRVMAKSRLKRPTIGDWVIVVIMILLIAICLLPVMTVVATSFSSAHYLIRREITFWPRGFHIAAYQDVIGDSRFMWSLAWTGILTGIVIVANLIMTILCAYPLTYDSLKGRKILTVLIIFTMYFNAGLVPTFMLFRRLGLLNNPMVLIIPGMISVFNMIIMRNFFFGIPDSLKESAEIDGAGPLTCLVKIYLPLSTPVLATIGLFVAVGRWNGFMDALFFLPGNARFHPIQLLLYNILNNITAVDVQDPGAAQAPGWGETVQAAAIVIAMVPILCVYPWVQKYFVQGATLGAVKG